MEKINNALLWVEACYTLFIEEGLDGIQIERLARILGRNSMAEDTKALMDQMGQYKYQAG